MIVAAAGAIDERDGIVVANAIHMAIGPNFDSDGILSALQVRINLVWGTIDDVDVSSIGLPAGCAGRGAKALIGEGDTAVMLVLEFVGG